MHFTLFVLLTLFVVVNHALQNGQTVGTCTTVGAISCYSGTMGFITCQDDMVVYRDCDPGTTCFEGPEGPYCALAACNIQITVDQIPVIAQPLPVYKLGDKVIVSSDYLSDIIENVSDDAELTSFGGQGAFAAFDDDRLVGFINPGTGESRVFPRFEHLKPCEGLADKATAAGNKFASDASLFPPDDTELVVVAPTTLSGSRSWGKGNATDPDEYLAFVSLKRQINGIPVYGPGTQATIAIGADGNILGFAHRYRPAFVTTQFITPHPPSQVIQSIMNDLSSTCSREQVTINNVVVSYFDDGNNTIQPVYSYSGSIPSSDNATAHSHISGSISIGNTSQPIMPIPTTDYPSNSPAGFYRYARDLRMASRNDQASKVGRYVVRADSFQWLDSATAFLQGLQSASPLGGTLSFTDDQYLAAVPDMFTSQRNQFINSVQIALNEVHGNWGEFTTYKDFGDIVTLAEIAAAGGLGSNAGGFLAYWIIHSCEVIPTQTDESTSFDVWWDIFRGLHSVVGYRTDMWIDDGVPADVGLWVGLGAAVIPAWFLEIATNNLYVVNDAVYQDKNRGITEPMGRPSSVNVCGHADDTAEDVDGIDDPTCLFEFWFDN
jgi:hypothetical protein